ncbi:MAG: asparagine synthase (glutamine-hydrolyzing) [Nitrospinae bacterium]|nr:asparagine synthase (glutamine-hydrolyzing) [Nitrospinota bacterium]
MCGIAGIWDSSLRPDETALMAALNRMLDSMNHRGPDDRGAERLRIPNGSTVYLGHRRLSIIDLSPRGHQPMANGHGTVWVSYNGEIYNFKDLRRELEPKYAFHSDSDTEVLLKAYEEWGVECLGRLRGMFAFAIWDSVRRVLFLARDRMGIKPLYYHSAPDRFLFASEVRALRSSGLAKTGIDPVGLYHYLAFGRLQSPETILANIRELKPAHYFLVDLQTGGITGKRYWNPVQVTGPLALSAKEIEVRVRELVEESVALRMISDVPLGAFLSGGIDSSVVAGVMAKVHNAPVKTLSIVFEEKEYDESRYAALAADRFRTEHEVLRLREQDLLAALPAAIGAMDQPTVDGINTFLISRSAREAGLTVALSGLGGDELFGGYDSFRSVPSLARWERMLGSLPGGLRLLAGEWLQALAPGSDRNAKIAHLIAGRMNGSHVYFLFRTLFCDGWLGRLLEDRKLVEAGRRNLLETSQAVMDFIKPLGPVEKISYLELTQYMANMLLRDTDAMSMAHSLEVRVPLIDHKLAEFMFQVPGRLKLAPPVPKSLLAQAAPGGLPNDLTARKKMGFTLPFESWMRTRLKNEMETVLSSPVASLTGVLSPTAVNEVWRDFCGHKVTWSRPWSLYILKKWAERNLQ